MFNVPVHAGWMSANQNLPTAVLIDGENIGAGDFEHLQTILNSIAGIGITRVFGDFANGSHSDWLKICCTHGLEPVLHCSPFSGKNGTDILMTIAAMDILATGTFRRIVLVSNDRDFLALARRLRAGGLEVVGIGSRNKASVLSAAYSKWILLPKMPKPKHQPNAAKNSVPPESLRKAIMEIIVPDGESLGALGKKLRKFDTSFAGYLGKGKLKRIVAKDNAFRLEGQRVSLRAA